jgi:hypothetical protein
LTAKPAAVMVSSASRTTATTTDRRH